jgi:hypothetical protein
MWQQQKQTPNKSQQGDCGGLVGGHVADNETKTSTKWAVFSQKPIQCLEKEKVHRRSLNLLSEYKTVLEPQNHIYIYIYKTGHNRSLGGFDPGFVLRV